MISFTPTEDQQQLIETIRRFAKNDMQPAAHDADEHNHVPANLINKGWDLGLLPTAIPEELGGLGEMSAITGALAMEELAYGDLSTSLQVMSPALFAYPLVLYGTEEQRTEHLPKFLEERPPHYTAAFLEPGIFFDPNELKTTASANGEKVVLNGTKAYVPLASSAEWLLVYARDTETGRVDGYIVNVEAAGVQIGERERLMGIRALPTHQVCFTNTEIDLNNKVSIDYPALLNRFRVALAAAAVGVARASFEYARDYAKQRVQFGVPIAQKQAIAFMLAEMAIEIDSARLLAWEAAWKLDEGEDATREAYLAKQYADKAAMFVTDSGVQTLGGYGFIREYPVERYLRNARGFATFDGLAIV
jgi:acyl-CoA dehydrogenase